MPLIPTYTYTQYIFHPQIINICLEYICHDPNYNYDDDEDDDDMEMDEEEEEEWAPFVWFRFSVVEFLLLLFLMLGIQFWWHTGRMVLG